MSDNFYRTPVDVLEVDGDLIAWLDCGHARPNIYPGYTQGVMRKDGGFRSRVWCRRCWEASGLRVR